MRNTGRVGTIGARGGLAVLVCMAFGQALAAEPEGIAIGRGTGPESVTTAQQLSELPPVQLSISFETEHGPRQASFEGPLLWTVLDHAGAVDAAKPREQVRQAVRLTGRDGYTAILALGEISPAFENKQVILAERMDGQPLPPGHFRIVVPGDRYGGRSVRDVARIVVTAPEPQPPPGH